MRNNRHQLLIKSLWDADATCSCGAWAFTRPGRVSRNYVLGKWCEHVNYMLDESRRLREGRGRG